MDKNPIDDYSKEALDSTVSYIKEGIKLGYSKDILRKRLLNKNYPVSLINESFIEYKRIEDEEKKSEFQKKVPAIRKYAFLSLLILFTIALISFGVTYFLDREVVCKDQSCFLNKAEACKNAVYEVDEGYAKFSFKSTSDCKLTKEILSMSKDEPDIMIELLDKKTLTCEYKKNLFDERVVTTMVSGLENCEGDLKDSLYELAILEHEIFLAGI